MKQSVSNTQNVSHETFLKDFNEIASGYRPRNDDLGENVKPPFEKPYVLYFVLQQDR
jgi:hypothetical protein